MKTKFAPLLALLVSASLLAHAETRLSVAATAVPHAEILEHVKPALAKEGVILEIKVFTDYIQPNVQVAEKKIDANFFQHQPYLDEFNKNKGQSYKIGRRELTRASLSEIKKMIDFWRSEIAAT